MTERNRPRRTLSLDPATEAYLGQPEVNAGRLIDKLVERNVADHKLREAALSEGVTDDDTEMILHLDTHSGRAGADRQNQHSDEGGN